jgi:hypothetical protein
MPLAVLSFFHMLRSKPAGRSIGINILCYHELRRNRLKYGSVSTMSGSQERRLREERVHFRDMSRGANYRIKGTRTDLRVTVLASGMSPLVEARGRAERLSAETAPRDGFVMQLLGWVPLRPQTGGHNARRMFFIDANKPSDTQCYLMVVIMGVQRPEPVYLEIDAIVSAV